MLKSLESETETKYSFSNKQNRKKTNVSKTKSLKLYARKSYSQVAVTIHDQERIDAESKHL